MLLVEFDLAGAEWVVVAHLAGDANMLDVVKSGRSPHVVTGSLISGASEAFVLEENKVVGGNTDPDTIDELRSSLDIPPGIFLPRSMSIRQAGKRSNHGCNYYMRYRRFALENEMPEDDAQAIVAYYSEKAYPGLQDYWRWVRDELQAHGRCLENCLGRKVRLVGEWGTELWMAAYSFIPQSTVFDVCMEGMLRAYNDESMVFSSMEVGAQVHDSAMANYPMPNTKDEWYQLASFIDTMANKHMRTELRYTGAADKVERAFTLGSDAKIGFNWGTMHGIKATGDLDQTIDSIKQALNLSSEGVAGEDAEWSATDLQSPPLPSA